MARLETDPHGFWKAKVKQYGAKYFGRAPNRTSDPRRVRHLFSTGFPRDPQLRGFRWYAFENNRDLQDFLAQVSTSEPCENPIT